MSFALRFEHPLLRLLILDWRFTFLLALLLPIVSFAIILPLKLWKRTPPGFTPEIRVSALDLIQARALARSARAAGNNGDFPKALQAWHLALANDPCNYSVAAGYIYALLQSAKRQDLERAIQIALWVREVFPTTAADELVILAAEANQAWDLVQQAAQRMQLSKSPLRVKMCVLKALFRSGRLREAGDFLQAHNLPGLRAELYREALDCILTPASKTTQCVKLRQNLQSGSHKIEAIELYLITSAEKRDLSEFEATFNMLRQITDRTLTFELLHLRLLLHLERWPEAREVVNRFRAPASARETVEIAQALLQVGDRTGATTFLRGYCSEFLDSPKHRTLYARLLLEQGQIQELENLRQQLLNRPLNPAENVLVHAIACLLQPSGANLAALSAALHPLSDPSCADSWYFAAAILVKADHPQLAWSLLKSIEPPHIDNSEFYGNLFAVAEATKDAGLMRQVAERCYQLSPNDPRTISNYAAILVMYEEEVAHAVALSALCLKANPASVAARINYAAALVNSESFGAADLVLREIDESSLSPTAKNQLLFIKLKRAFKLSDALEISRLSALLDKSGLYSVQLGWLEDKRI